MMASVELHTEGSAELIKPDFRAEGVHDEGAAGGCTLLFHTSWQPIQVKAELLQQGEHLDNLTASWLQRCKHMQALACSRAAYGAGVKLWIGQRASTRNSVLSMKPLITADACPGDNQEKHWNKVTEHEERMAELRSSAQISRSEALTAGST